MAKKSWTKSLKALFGKGSDDSEADQEEKKKKEVWEKEEEKKSSVIEEDVVSDDILLESEEDIPSREEARGNASKHAPFRESTSIVSVK